MQILWEQKKLYTLIVTSVSLIAMVKITRICVTNTALEMKFPQKLHCCYFHYHLDYHNLQ